MCNALVHFFKQVISCCIISPIERTLEGKGVGSQLVKQTLEQIKTTDKKIVPSCPFIAAYIKRHPEYESLVK